MSKKDMAKPVKTEQTVIDNEDFKLNVPMTIDDAEKDGEMDSRLVLSDERKKRLDEVAENFVNKAFYSGFLTSIDQSISAGITADIDSMGMAEAKEIALSSNNLMKRQLKELDNSSVKENKKVVKSLMDMENKIVELNPAKAGINWDDPLRGGRIFGIKLPFIGDKLQKYIQKTRDASQYIEMVNKELDEGSRIIRESIGEIDLEKQKNLEITMRSNEYLYLNSAIVKKVESRMVENKLNDKEKELVTEVILYPLEQKKSDLNTQIHVAITSYYGLDVIQKNNKELLRGVQRCQMVALPALNTSITMASALADQKNVHDTVGAINQTAGEMLNNVSTMVSSQSQQIQKSAQSETIKRKSIMDNYKKIEDALKKTSEYRLQAHAALKKDNEKMEELTKNAVSMMTANKRHTAEKLLADENHHSDLSLD
jgi:toxic anion resistance family protein